MSSKSSQGNGELTILREETQNKRKLEYSWLLTEGRPRLFAGNLAGETIMEGGRELLVGGIIEAV
jgi:hypothetical protein